jgi:hypothetical protein
MEWHSYSRDQRHFPFSAWRVARRATSPLRQDQEVRVVGLASTQEGKHEMCVMVTWEQRMLAVPLARLEPTAAHKAGWQVSSAGTIGSDTVKRSDGHARPNDLNSYAIPRGHLGAPLTSATTEP